jgi:hypothetical protein
LVTILAWGQLKETGCLVRRREKEKKTNEAQKNKWHSGKFVVPLSCGDDSNNCSTHAQKKQMASSEANHTGSHANTARSSTAPMAK